MEHGGGRHTDDLVVERFRRDVQIVPPAEGAEIGIDGELFEGVHIAEACEHTAGADVPCQVHHAGSAIGKGHLQAIAVQMFRCNNVPVHICSFSVQRFNFTQGAAVFNCFPVLKQFGTV